MPKLKKSQTFVRQSKSKKFGVIPKMDYTFEFSLNLRRMRINNLYFKTRIKSVVVEKLFVKRIEWYKIHFI